MIRIDGLSVRFGEVRAVDELTLHIPEASLFGLLGPNGAGKTTTISCIAALRTPTAGRVRVAGQVVAREPARVQRMLGLVPQSLALYPTLSVVKNLRLFGGLFGLGGKRLRERVSWGLALAQLEAKADTEVCALSGGMKRRLNLACALLHDPEVIICDEPTTGVDPQSRNHLFETIADLHREGRTVLYTTHYMEEVEALCDRVAVIDGGCVVADDTLDGLLRAVGKPKRFDVTLDQGCDEEALRAELESAGLPLAGLSEHKRSLEQVFLELTGKELRDAS